MGAVSAGKFQLNDDSSGSYVNTTVTCKEQVTVDGVDRIVAIVKLGENSVKVTRHADFCAMVEFFGKYHDLEATYKQCPFFGR